MTIADRLPPGKFGLPLVGQSLSFLFDSKFSLKQRDRYGAISKTHIFGQPAVMMIGPEAAEFVLASGMEYLEWGGGWPRPFRVLLGERALFLQDGEEHRRNRKLLMPAFHGPVLQRYVTTMDTVAQAYIDRWVAQSQNQGEITWFTGLKEFTFDIASQLLIGVESGEDVSRLSQLFDRLSQGLFGIFPERWKWSRLAKAIEARDALLDHIAQAIAQRKAQPKNDALSLLVQAVDEEGQSLSDAELTAQAMLMLFAGHETTTSMLASTCLELGRHPEMLQRAREEQAQFASAIALDQMSQMPYLDRVLLEVERLHPPVGGGFRRVVKPFTFQGYTVPAGWLLLYSAIATHSDPTLFPEPERFDPDRFIEKPQPYSLLGFGGGPRVCMGIAFAKLEMKILLAKLLRGYDWAIVPGQDVRDVVVPTRRPKDGLRVTLKPRVA